MSHDGGPDPSQFLSGEAGHVAPRRQRPLLRLRDAAAGARLRLGGSGRRIDRLAAEQAPRDVLVLGVYRPGSRRIEAAARELARTRHRVHLALGSTGEALPGLAGETVRTGLAGGKFQNLNALLERTPARDADWVLVIDDDAALPRRFLDRLIALAARFDLALAQPALSLASHSAWAVTRRRPGTLVRETRFVEIGPVTLFRADAVAELLPFPDLRFGWGLDLHWAALAARRGWHLGVVDAVPVRHEEDPVASGYSHQDAVAEARAFLAQRPFLPSAEARDVVAEHARL